MAEHRPRLAHDARKHVKRGRPRGAVTEHRGEAPPVPTPGSAPAPTPTPASAPAPSWAELAPMAKQLTDPIYAAVGAEPPHVMVWMVFCGAWGSVVDKYLPGAGARPEIAALVATAMVAVPLVHAWPAYRAKLAQQAREARERAGEVKTPDERTRASADAATAAPRRAGGIIEPAAPPPGNPPPLVAADGNRAG